MTIQNKTLTPDQIAAAAKDYNVDPRDIFFALGKRNAVAGQESLIIEVAQDLAARNAVGKVSHAH